MTCFFEDDNLGFLKSESRPLKWHQCHLLTCKTYFSVFTSIVYGLNRCHKKTEPLNKMHGTHRMRALVGDLKKTFLPLLACRMILNHPGGSPFSVTDITSGSVFQSSRLFDGRPCTAFSIWKLKTSPYLSTSIPSFAATAWSLAYELKKEEKKKKRINKRFKRQKKNETWVCSTNW